MKPTGPPSERKQACRYATERIRTKAPTMGQAANGALTRPTIHSGKREPVACIATRPPLAARPPRDSRISPGVPRWLLTKKRRSVPSGTVQRKNDIDRREKRGACPRYKTGEERDVRRSTNVLTLRTNSATSYTASEKSTATISGSHIGLIHNPRSDVGDWQTLTPVREYATGPRQPAAQKKPGTKPEDGCNSYRLERRRMQMVSRTSGRPLFARPIAIL